jgi:hypothetical protein
VPNNYAYLLPIRGSRDMCPPEFRSTTQGKELNPHVLASRVSGPTYQCQFSSHVACSAQGGWEGLKCWQIFYTRYMSADSPCLATSSNSSSSSSSTHTHMLRCTWEPASAVASCEACQDRANGTDKNQHQSWALPKTCYPHGIGSMVSSLLPPP